MEYEPTKPYVIKGGKRKGKALELLMFNDYGFLRWHLAKIKKMKSGTGKNEYEKHLEWLLKRGEDRKPKMICPICGEKRVQYFSIRRSRGGYDFSISPSYTCCEKEECRSKLRAKALGGPVQLVRPKFSNILRYAKLKRDRKRIADLYKEIFMLPTTRLTRKRAFQFFKE